MTWLLKLLEKVSPDIVDSFREGLALLLDKLEEKAKATPNKWDDIFIDMARRVLLND